MNYYIIIFALFNATFCMHKEVPSLKMLAAKSIVAHNLDFSALDCDLKEYLSLIERNKNNFKSACYESIFAGTSHLPDLILVESQKVKNKKAQKKLHRLFQDLVAKTLFFNNDSALKILCKYVDVNEPINKNNTALLMVAAYDPNIELAQILLDQGADISVSDDDKLFSLYNNRSVFMHAASANNTQFMKLLFKKGIDINTENNEKHTALTYAAMVQAIDAVKYLLKKGADVNKGKNSPLFCAMHEKNDTIVELLLSSGAHSDPACLRQAICNNDAELLQKLFAKGGNELIKIYGNALLHLCVWQKQNNCAEILINHDVSIDEQDEYQNTVLHKAVDNNEFSLVKLLLRCNANPHLKNYQGATPLTKAAYQGHEHIVEYFLNNIPLQQLIADQQEEKLFQYLQDGIGQKRGMCVINLLKKLLNRENLSLYVDATGAIPRKIRILSAMVHDDVELFKQLIYQDMNFKSNVVNFIRKKISSFWKDRNLNEPLVPCGTTMLESTICFKTKNIFEYLLAHKANPNMRDRYGNTALHYAARYGDVPFIEALIQHNAHVDVENNLGNTPLLCALQAKNSEGADCLIDLGADMNDRYSIAEAISCSSISLIKKILNHQYFKPSKNNLTEAAKSAIAQKNITIMNILLNYDVSIINERIFGECPNETLLIKSMSVQDPKIIESLLSKGANPHCRQFFGQTALIIAAQENKLKSAEILLNHYDNNNNERRHLLNARCHAGRTALIYAAANNHHEMVKLLLKFGAEIFIKDIYGSDALMHARLNGNKEIENIIKQEILTRINRK